MSRPRILVGDCRATLATLDAESVQCCVTSPPYFGLRDYGVDGQIGRELTPDAYVAELVAVFHAVRRVLRADGTLWLNLGDSYAGSWGARGRGADTNAPRADFEAKHGTAAPARNGFESIGVKPKDLIGIPWRVAFALQADGWYLRSDIIWHKPNPMPESVTDRPTKAHEYVFLLTKSERYYYDADAIAEPATARETGNTSHAHDRYNSGSGRQDSDSLRQGYVPRDFRNARSVWTIPTRPFTGAHFATMPPALAERCIKAGTKPGDTVLDPFGGAGTTGLVADRLGRAAILCELNPTYAALAGDRITDDAPLFAAGGAA